MKMGRKILMEHNKSTLIKGTIVIAKCTSQEVKQTRKQKLVDMRQVYFLATSWDKSPFQKTFLERALSTKLSF